MRRQNFLASTLLVLLLTALSAAQHSTPRAHSKTQTRASAAVTAPTVQAVDLDGLKKLLQRDAAALTRPLLVTFWATWCGPCREEFPDLVKIDGEFRGDKLDYITISLDDLADIKTGVPKYLRGMHAQMPAYLLNASGQEEQAIKIVDPNWIGDLPATFLYDAQGKIIYKHTGRIDPTELRTALKAVTSDK